MPDKTSLDTRVAVTNNVIEVTMGAARASVPVDQLDSLLRLLEGCRLIASASSSAGLAPSATTPALPAPAAAAAASPAPAAPVGRGPGRPRKDGSAAQPTRPAAESARAPKAGGGRKRRSRKRVGDALVGWMEANPGWHSEEHLLSIVIDNKMSDASPKRALKIALGKQRGDLFEGDGQGHWKLKSDTSAGGPPTPKPKERKKPGRKPKALTQAASAEAEAKTRTTPVKVAPAKAQPKAAKAEKPEKETKAAAPAPEAEAAPQAPAPSETPAGAEEVKAGESKEASQKRKSLRVKKKSTLPPAAAAEAEAEPEAQPEAQGDEGEEAESGKEGPTSRLVRVKPGQDRKSASFAPGEKEAREEAAQRTGARKSARWNGVSNDEVERARRNLLGLGGGGAKPRGAVENDKA